MFTGIITDIGRIATIDRRDATGGDRRIVIVTTLPLTDVALGASIACNGVCLTVVEKSVDWFAVDVSAETLARTTLGDWQPDGPVNLERSLRLGDELGGHLVYGHVDGVATIRSIRPDGDSRRYEFQTTTDLGRFIAAKRSVALEGVSLTVNSIEDAADGCRFGVNLIPHTQQQTTLGRMDAGARVNLEVDMLARYVARLGHTQAQGRM